MSPPSSRLISFRSPRPGQRTVRRPSRCAPALLAAALTLLNARSILSWYKRKPSDAVIFNEGNSAATYNEQRLFLASGLNRSTRLLGGATYGGDNQIYAHKRGDHKAEMS